MNPLMLTVNCWPRDYGGGLQLDVQCRDDYPAPGCVGEEERQSALVVPGITSDLQFLVARGGQSWAL